MNLHPSSFFSELNTTIISYNNDGESIALMYTNLLFHMEFSHSALACKLHYVGPLGASCLVIDCWFHLQISNSSVIQEVLSEVSVSLCKITFYTVSNRNNVHSNTFTWFPCLICKSRFCNTTTHINAWNVTLRLYFTNVSTQIMLVLPCGKCYLIHKHNAESTLDISNQAARKVE